MSKYNNFREEIFGRTQIIWEECLGRHKEDGFETTLAISILSMVLMRVKAIGDEYGGEPFYHKFAEIVRKHSRICYGENNVCDAQEQDDEKVVRRLRNGFAHIFIYPEQPKGKITGVKICSRKEKPCFTYYFEAEEFCAFVDESLDFMRCFEAERKDKPDKCPEVQDGNADLR